MLAINSLFLFIHYQLKYHKEPYPIHVTLITYPVALLFKKIIIARRIPLYLVTMLCYWYQNQSMYIKWGSTVSEKFHVTNDVGQGGVLPPFCLMYMSMSLVTA